MKKILYICIATLLYGCGNKLDVKTYSEVSSDQAKKDVTNMLAGAYGLIGSGNTFQNGAPLDDNGALYGNDLILAGDLLASENYIRWRGTFQQYAEISNKQITTTNTTVFRIWRKAYKAINLANIVLENLSNAPAAKREQYRGEALFIRSIMHYELVKLFGEYSSGLGVPIMLNSTELFENIQKPARATMDQVFNQVITDLTESKSLLPDDNGEFANKYIASAFLARVYLTMGDFAKALAEANFVISESNKSLPATAYLSFNTSGGSENIFEIPQTETNNAGTTNDGLSVFYTCDPDAPGNSGRGDVNIEEDFLIKYDSSDIRLKNLIYTGTCSKGSVTSKKWFDPFKNIPIIRLSEMYLIRAECNIRLGNISADPSPLADVNALRSKAGLSAYTTINLDTVLLERELELAFEGHRVHDFKRNNTGDYRSDKYSLPIPQQDINTNSNLIQNSYYK